MWRTSSSSLMDGGRSMGGLNSDGGRPVRSSSKALTPMVFNISLRCSSVCGTNMSVRAGLHEILVLLVRHQLVPVRGVGHLDLEEPALLVGRLVQQRGVL